MKKLPYARRQEILGLLEQNNCVDIAQLSEHFNVSSMTIHRDIDELERSGMVSRIYGGVAIAPRDKQSSVLQAVRDLPIEERFKVSLKSKQAIAKHAATFVEDGDIIGMDPSTTTLHMCPYLNERNITVVTNSISVALQFSGSPTVDVVLLGGYLRKSALTLLGPRVADSAQYFNLTKCFLSASSLSFPEGLTDLSMEEPEAKRSLISRAVNVYALVDDTKLGRVSPFVVCPPKAMTALITNADAAPSEAARNCLSAYEENGVAVIRA